MKMGFTAALFGVLICCGGASAQDRRAEFLDESKWPAFVQDRPLKAAEGDTPLVRLLKERHNAAVVELRNRYIYWLQGHGALAEVCENAQRVAASRTDADLPAVDRVQVLKEKLEFAETVSRQAEAPLKAERSTHNMVDKYFAKYYHLDAELEYMRAKQEPPKGNDKATR